MPQPKPKALIERTLLVLAALSLVLGVWALGFLQDISSEDRALLIISSSVGVLGSFVGLLLVRFTRRWWRKRASQKVLTAWQKLLHSDRLPIVDLAHYLSQGTLRILAMQLFSRIGYAILNRDEDEENVYVRMVNPDGELELVCCKQQATPIEIGHLYQFRQDIQADGAVRGHFFAPGGFTPEAIHWAGQKPILLADRYGIGHLVDCVQAHRSRLFDG